MLSSVDGCVEGVQTAAAATALVEARGIELPLVQAVHRIATGQGDAAVLLDEILGLDLTLGAELISP